MKSHITTGAERRQAVGDWLSAAAPQPEEAWSEWRQRRVALLSCGALFAAVRVHEAVVHAAAGTTLLSQVDAYLAGALLAGPVIHDREARHYYALVPASTARVWKTPASVCLGRGTSLGVPAPGVSPQDDQRVYWAVPMDSPAELCSPGAVSQLVMTGRHREVVR